jgi:hypothetical protein
MPFVAQILEDSYIAPEYLHLPRMLLTSHHTTQGTVLCCAVLCCTVLCCAVLHYTVLCCTVLRQNVLYCNVMCSVVLCCCVLYYTSLHCIVLHCIHILLYCTAFYRIIISFSSYTLISPINRPVRTKYPHNLSMI